MTKEDEDGGRRTEILGSNIGLFVITCNLLVGVFFTLRSTFQECSELSADLASIVADSHAILDNSPSNSFPIHIYKLDRWAMLNVSSMCCAELDKSIKLDGVATLIADPFQCNATNR